MTQACVQWPKQEVALEFGTNSATVAVSMLPAPRLTGLLGHQAARTAKPFCFAQSSLSSQA